MSQTAAVRPIKSRPPRRQIIAGVVGMMLELYDWQVFGFMAVYIGAHVFNPADPFTGLLNTLLVFAVGFLMRPIGGAILGAYADRHGRKAGMILGLIMLGVGSLMIAVVPTYSQVGSVAGFILVAARILQGIGVGGEQGAAVSFLSEIAPEGKRALYNAFGYIASSIAVVFAVLLAAVLPALLGDAAMGDWGWRIPFVIGALFTVYAIIMRRTMTETEQFVQAKEAGGQPGGSLSLLFRSYWKQCLLTVAFVAGSTFTYYVFVLQYSTFAHIVTGIELSAAQLLTALVIIVFAALQPVYGWLSDRIGRKKVLLFSVIGTLVTMWPALLLVTDNAAVVIGLQLLVVVPVAAAASVANATLAELFPTQVRALGVAFPYAISVALFGGTAPFVMTYLAGNGHVSLLALYGTALLALTTVAILAMRERSQQPLISAAPDHSDPSQGRFSTDLAPNGPPTTRP